MRAVVKVRQGEGNIEIMEVEEPAPGPGELKIEVKACGICGSDIHIYHGRMPCTPPVILGHEFSGVVAELGQGVKNFKVGDRVACEPVGHVCGECRLCMSGNYTLCPEWTPLGRKKNGAFARYVVVSAQFAHELPGNVDPVAGAFCEPLACVVHGVLEEGEAHAGEVAVVSGCGTIGLLACQVLKASGCEVVVCGLTRDLQRLDLARKLGAGHCLNVEKEDPVAFVNGLTGGYGADVGFECAGSPQSIDNCLRLVKKRGRIIQFGLFGSPVLFDYEQVVYKELKLIGTWAYVKSTWDRVMKLLADGKVNLGAVVSHKLPISRWREGFERMESKDALSVALCPED